MKQSPPTLQDNYQYDALDRLTTRNATHRFYQNDRIAIEVEGANTRRFIAFDAQPLAVQEGQATSLLATDRQTSVLQQVSAAGTQACAYTPYGHHPAENGITPLLAFNGEHPEAVTGHYLLGQGYRAYNPVLMRFISPDSWSPFGKGGINAYAYSHKPLDEVDPSGHFSFKPLLRALGLMEKSTVKTNALLTDQFYNRRDIRYLLDEGVTRPRQSPEPPQNFGGRHDLAIKHYQNKLNKNLGSQRYWINKSPDIKGPYTKNYDYDGITPKQQAKLDQYHREYDALKKIIKADAEKAISSLQSDELYYRVQLGLAYQDLLERRLMRKVTRYKEQIAALNTIRTSL